MFDFNQFVAASLAEGQRVFPAPAAGVADQVRPVGRVLQLLVDLLPRDVAPVPLGFQEARVSWTPARH